MPPEAGGDLNPPGPSSLGCLAELLAAEGDGMPQALSPRLCAWVLDFISAVTARQNGEQGAVAELPAPLTFNGTRELYDAEATALGLVATFDRERYWAYARSIGVPWSHAAEQRRAELEIFAEAIHGVTKALVASATQQKIADLLDALEAPVTAH